MEKEFLMKPLFSIVMPIYNQEKYLQKAIDCIKNQSYIDYELILVNDGSTDRSEEICFHNKDSKIKIITQENLGLSEARNTGLKKSTGKYILFLDPDDAYSTDLLNILYRFIEKENPDLLIYGLEEIYYSSDEKLEYKKKIVPKTYIYDNKKAIYEMALQLEQMTLFGYAWNKCYRSELLKQNQLYFKTIKMIEDISFNLELLPHLKNVITIDQSVYKYAIRNTNSSLTKQKLVDYLDLHTNRIHLFINEYSHTMPSLLDSCKKTMAPIYCRYLLSAIERKGFEDPNWLKYEFSSNLFNTLQPYMDFQGKKKWFYYPFIHKSVILSVFEGRVTHFIKKRLPSLFARLKQTR